MMFNHGPDRLCLSTVGVLAVCWLAAPALAESQRPLIDYNRDIRPILSDNCYACHGPDENTVKAGLRLHTREHALAELRRGRRAIVPGDSAGSTLIERVAAEDELDRMPPARTGKQLTPRQIDLLREWIDQGAQWQEHWSFVKPERPEPPPVQDVTWPRNTIDHFILSRLEQHGMQPSFEADKVTLVRRLTLDLTGLPPTIAEVDAFLNDASPDACEKLVDRLLDSPHYGERMAQEWLDLARYGDTNGYHYDSDRSMWPYRDYVIKAFNDNKPFDRFTIEQIAGDLLPNRTIEQRVATGFNRNVTYNEEGGADPEEFRVKYAVDRANTTATAYLGLTLSCAECHDHKYDPISQREFYQFYAFFNNIDEPGAEGHDRPVPPLLKLPRPEQEQRLEEIKSLLEAAEAELNERPARVAEAQAEWEQHARASLGSSELSHGLVVHYEMDARDERRVLDSSGNYRHGTYAGGQPAWADGKAGSALKFDGQGHAVDAGHIANFERTEAFSYGCWVRYQGPGGVMIARMDESQAHRGFDVGINKKKIWAHVIHAWPANALKVTTTSELPAESWHHVMVTYDGSSTAAGLRIYVDGKLREVTVDKDTLTETIRGEVPLYIGKRHTSIPFHGLIDDVRVYNRFLTAAQVAELAGPAALQGLLAVAPEHRSEEENVQITRYYLENHDPEYADINQNIAALHIERDQIDKDIPHTMVMEEMPERRPAFVLIRGDFQNPGEQVAPDVPAILPLLPAGQPANRLGLAHWLVSEENPLTARVTVNRLWKQFFGAGIVATADDFGAQGEAPSHPELLDWLATEFISGGWDVKALVRTIVTSSTYRQSSNVRQNHHESDPYNRLLYRAPRFRLPAEQIRDVALAAGGLLNLQVGGQSVRPYQPEDYYKDKGRWKWEESTGPDLYRRGMYTFWRRTTFYPSFQIFDAPSREFCTVDRPRTNTPLQALVTLNDPVYVEAARVFGQRILREGGDTLTDRLVFAFRTTLAREPRPQEIGVLSAIFREQHDRYRQDEAAATALVSHGRYHRPEELDVAELAAWTACASMLLNLDETIMRE